MFYRFQLVAFTAVCLGASLSHAAPPNVVFIVADDMGYADYGCQGHPHVRTPHLDRLASQSRFFPRGYVVNSLCRPSLATILTGLYPHQHRITSNDPPIPPGVKKNQAERDPTFLADRQRMIANIDRVATLPRTLATLGYASFQTGKWWEGNFQRGGFTEGMSAGGRHGDKGLDIGRVSLEPMFDFVDRSTAAGKPFFLWYAPMLPHTPHDPPERLLDHYRALTPSLPLARYWAMCEWFDETCGELLAFLDRKQLADNTLVVYITDNGWIQQPDGNGYAPKSKQSPNEGGLRTPIFLRLPGRISPRRSDALAQSIDLAPTVLKLVGLPVPAELPGVDLLDDAAVARRETLFGECFEHNAVDLDRPARSLRWRWCVSGNWKLIVPHAPNVVGPVELYDVRADAGETQNRAAEQPEVVARLQRELDRWWRPE